MKLWLVILLPLLTISALALPAPVHSSKADQALFLETKTKAEKGVAEEQNELGQMYSTGRGVAQNEAEAVKWYRKAADQNYAKAQSNLGAMYQHGRGVQKSEAEAIKWYGKAADQNFAAGQFNLGISYWKGEGVPKNEAEGLKWLHKAADQNFPKALDLLGSIYARINMSKEEALQFSVAKDDVLGFKLFSKSAEQGDKGAQFSVGFMLARGLGITKDERAAIKWYLRAAEQNLSDAQFELGRMYVEGSGVAKNAVTGRSQNIGNTRGSIHR